MYYFTHSDVYHSGITFSNQTSKRVFFNQYALYILWNKSLNVIEFAKKIRVIG